MVFERVAAASSIVLGVFAYALERLLHYSVIQVNAAGRFVRVFWQKATAPLRWLFWTIFVPLTVLSLIGVIAGISIGLLLSRVAIMLEIFGKRPEKEKPLSAGGSWESEARKDIESRRNSVRNSIKDSICIPLGNPFKSPSKSPSKSSSKSPSKTASEASSQADTPFISPERTPSGSLTRIFSRDKENIGRFESSARRASFKGIDPINELRTGKAYASGIELEDELNQEPPWESTDGVEDDNEEDGTDEDSQDNVTEAKDDSESVVVESPVNCAKFKPLVPMPVRRSKSQVAFYSQFRLSRVDQDSMPIDDVSEDGYRTPPLRLGAYQSRSPLPYSSLHTSPIHHRTVSLGLIREDREP